MATFAVRKNRRGDKIGIQAKVRRVGHEPQSKMFDVGRKGEAEAEKWARGIETDMDRGLYKIASEPEPNTVSITIERALQRYETNLSIRNGDVNNVGRLRGHLTAEMLGRPVAELSPTELSDWRDGLLDEVAASTVNRVITPLRAALNLAYEYDQGKTMRSRAPWDIGLKALPDADAARNVVIPDSEIAKLIAAAYRDSHGFGLLVETAAMTGARYSQVAGLLIRDLQGGDLCRLMMPSSRKGKGAKLITRGPVPIPAALVDRLAVAAKGRPNDAPLITRGDGAKWGPSDHSRPFARARLAAELDVNEIAPHTVGEITMYALRHSSIVRQIMQGVPLRVVAALHDTSVPMIERNYSRHIAGQSDAVVRAALPSIQVVVRAPLSKAAKTRRPGRDGQCPSGHSYQTYPPYENAAGSVVCAECARIRTARNKAAKRMLPTTGEHP